MTLWLARHARPLVTPGVCYGALNMPAEHQATQVAAEKLAAALPANTRVQCSTLQRCEQLAQALYALRPDLMPHFDVRLREMDFGSWEGQPWNAIAPAALSAWTADFAQYRPGGGESVELFMRRVSAAWDSMLDTVPGPTLWITHAGVARAVTLIAQGQRSVDRADQWPVAAPPLGEWVTF